jgi:hypothetical protein
VPGPAGSGGMTSAPPIVQWVQLANGRWISEKDPGYPFLAAPFQALGIIRLAPLFYGSLGCLGLFFGARRWLGRFGGGAAVGLYCSSGAALLFAWRDYMLTFTDASLIAAGTGALLWAVLAAAEGPGRRARLVARLGRAFGAGVAVFDDLVYGGPLKTGYRPGEIQFSLSAVSPNLRYMPAHLLEAMPMLVLALAAATWIIARWARLRRAGNEPAAGARRDLAVGLALAASWFSIWGLYAAYTWTAGGILTTLQSARFYVPAIGVRGNLHLRVIAQRANAPQPSLPRARVT